MDLLDKRQPEFQKNINLEKLLNEINTNLSVAEDILLEQNIKEYPVIFVMGAMRSGSTLMMQWLASMNMFAYPSNMLSRFYRAPIIGSKIQKMLTSPDYNFRNEIIDFRKDISFESNNGKTEGALSPNEFWYFWRRFLPDDLRGYSNEKLMDYVDIRTMRKELWGIAQVFDKPMALKGMICNYHISFLNKIFSKSLFICLNRDLERHTRSVLEARKRQFGTYDEWYSFLIPEYDELIQISDPEIQVKKQIMYINEAITVGLKEVPDQKKIQIKYENFCKDPSSLFYEIQDKLSEQGYLMKEKYVGSKQFIAR